MRTKPSNHFGRNRRGTIVAFMLIMLSVVIGGLVMTTAFTSGTQTQVASITFRRDQAFYAAEAGIQRAYWELEYNNWAGSGFPVLTDTVGASSYSVSAVGSPSWDSPILISSVGSVGTQIQTTVSAVCSPTTIVPAISLGNTFDNGGNVTINGDVQVKGNVNTHGKLDINGFLQYGGSLTMTGNYTITGGTTPNNNITVPTVDINQIINNPPPGVSVQTIHVPQGTGKTYQVSSINFGQGGIVYFDGPIDFKGSVNITGYGTLIVNGDVSIQSASNFGSSNQKAVANIITTGDLDVRGYLGLVGSTYVGGTLDKSGGLDLTGVIVAQQSLTANGGMNITKAQPPWFDPRHNISGPASFVLSTFTGPLF